MPTRQPIHETWPERLTRMLAWLAGAIILIGCGALISIDVITRALFRRAVVESFEISGYAFAAAIGLGLGFTVTSKANVRVDVLLSVLPRRMRMLFDAIAALALTLIALALAWYCAGTLAQSWRMGARSISVLQVPLVIPQAIWCIGIFWFACMAVLVPIRAFARLAAGDERGFERLIGTLQVREEIAQAGGATELADRKPQ